MRLALKVDVDTHDGLARGLPRLLDLAAHRPLSVYVAMGPDNSGRAIRRIGKRQRLRLMRSRNLQARFFASTKARTARLSDRELEPLLQAKTAKSELRKADWAAFPPSAEHETKCIFLNFWLDILKNMHYCAYNH